MQFDDIFSIFRLTLFSHDYYTLTLKDYFKSLENFDKIDTYPKELDDEDFANDFLYYN